MLSEEQLIQSLRQDPLNLRRERNRYNTPCESYNCGGFALSIYDWICPYIRTDDSTAKYDLPDDAYTDEAREDLMDYFIESNWTETDIEEEILQQDTIFLLNQYPFLEPIQLSECEAKDVVIAYRIFINVDEELGIVEDTDFHFRVRINGFWFEKLGREEVKLCTFEDSAPWVVPNSNMAYTSQIKYFIVKRGYTHEQIK